MAKKKSAEGDSNQSVTQLVTKWLLANRDAKATQIIEHFARQGIVVSHANAQKIRYNTVGGGSKSNAVKPNAVKSNAAKSEPVKSNAVGKPGKSEKRMTRASKPKRVAHGEKSQVLRKLFKQHGLNARPKAIIEGGAALGYTISYPEVTRIRLQMEKLAREEAAGGSNGAFHTEESPVVASMSVDLLVKVRDFARTVGGRRVVEQAFEALDMLAN